MTHDAVGGMHVRPMTTQQVEPPGIVWMFMSARGRLAEEVAANPDVLLTYGDPGDGAYAVVRGQAIAVHDIAKASANCGRRWPARGSRAVPRIRISRCCASRCRGPKRGSPLHGKVLQFLEIAAAALTKSVPQDDGTYRRIDF